MESLFLLAFGEEEFLAALAMADLEAFFNKLLNTAISFSTTTTWQAYAGENTMSYFSQMVGLCAQNFLAGAAGLAVDIAFIRGLAKQLSNTLGNFWVDLTRALLWILLPGALVGATRSSGRVFR